LVGLFLFMNWFVFDSTDWCKTWSCEVVNWSFIFHGIDYPCRVPYKLLDTGTAQAGENHCHPSG
jgi:hypothetical protein